MKTRTLLLSLVALFAVTFAASAQTLGSLSTLLSMPDGSQSSIAKLGEGKVTIVSFWATWCNPCKQEMKAMAPIYEKLKAQGVEYIAISIDNTKTMAKVGPYISAKGYGFPVLLDPNQDVFKSLNGTNVPYTLVFKADGSLYQKHDGYLEGDETKLEEELMKLAGQKTGSLETPVAAPSTASK